RGIDIENVEYSLKRAALLIKEIAGGDITSEVVDLYSNKKGNFEVFLVFEKINKLIGQEIPQDTIKSILASLDIKVKNVTEAGMGLEIPSYRVDVQRQVDVIEEILRVYGYNNIDFSQKLNASIATSRTTEDHSIQKTIGNLLASKGYFEILANSLTSPEYNSLIEDTATKKSVEIINPLSGELSVLRKTSLFSALETASYNINRRRSNLKLFEFGKTYFYDENNDRKENKYLSLLLSGESLNTNWTTPSNPTHFFELKTVVETILIRLGLNECESAPVTSTMFSEGLDLSYKSNMLVSFGIVKKTILKHFDIKPEVLFADFNWDLILEQLDNTPVVFKEIPKYPEVKRDFALLLDNSISFKEVYDIAYRTEKKLLTNVSLFDVYEGKNLPEGKKSYAVSFTLQDDKSTLTDKQIDKIMSKLEGSYVNNLGASLR
ncbi:MAG: phenylalanine--tRNA ligase subunit beta, partial [Maribacter sp.]